VGKAEEEETMVLSGLSISRVAVGSGEDKGVDREYVDREYSVNHAREFYAEIASSYDLRNSGNLIATQLETIMRLQAIRAQRSPLRVLDLGGGTGRQVAHHFLNDEGIAWTYVDFCPKMAKLFQRNLADRPLGRNADIVVDDMNRVLQRREPASTDVVLLSLVLSSMPAMPDFSAIARILGPAGVLIITDISPSYTHENPLYAVEVGGERVALRTTPVDPVDVIRRAIAAGLQLVEMTPLGEDSTYYSFLTIFSAAAVGPEQEMLSDRDLPRNTAPAGGLRRVA
jgi:SAM-dependent methyltransferase